MERLNEASTALGSVVRVAVGGTLVIYAVALLGAQCLCWLKEGAWIAVSLYDIVVPRAWTRTYLSCVFWLVPEFYDQNFVSYLLGARPGTWVGLHKLVVSTLKIVPLSLASLFAGVLVFSLAEKRNRPTS